MVGVHIMPAPVSRQHVALARQFDACSTVSIGNAVHTVIVKRITIEAGATVSQYDIIPHMSHLIIAVIIASVSHQCQRITLAHLDMAVCLKGV